MTLEKSILVSYETWKEIGIIKFEENLASMDEVLKFLLKEHNKLRK